MPVKKVESLSRGLDILEVLSANPSGLKLQEITRRVGLPRATTYRLLQTLIAKDHVHYFKGTATFRLGPKVMSLGFSALSGLDLVKLAEPYLKRLSRTIRQNVNLGILDKTEIVYVIRIKVRRILGIELSVGSRLSAYNSAMGEALLAYLEPEELDSVLSEMAQDPKTASQIGPQGEILREKLDQVRSLGYALSEDEFVKGLRSVAVPVFNAQGLAEAAINVPVFSQLCTREELIEQHLPLVLETSQTISKLRGYRPG
ncbi:MAG: IclR family transcriptional regulator [Desulfarculaceae bacterium]|jgi:IclR family pca regulon transcriptional regulator